MRRSLVLFILTLYFDNLREQLHNLRRQKETLETKIMEQYKSNPTVAQKKKKSGFMDAVSKKTQQLVQKVRTKSANSSANNSSTNLNQFSTMPINGDANHMSVGMGGGDGLNVVINNNQTTNCINTDSTTTNSTESSDQMSFDLNFNDNINTNTNGNSNNNGSGNSSQSLTMRRQQQSQQPFTQFIDENRLNALSKELAASAHALNDIGNSTTTSSGSTTGCTVLHIKKSATTSLNDYNDHHTVLALSPINVNNNNHHQQQQQHHIIPIETENNSNNVSFGDKAKSDTIVNSNQQQQLITPRQQKILKIQRSSPNTTIQSPTLQQQITSPLMVTSPTSSINSDVYRQATSTYRTDHIVNRRQVQQQQNTTTQSSQSFSIQKSLLRQFNNVSNDQLHQQQSQSSNIDYQHSTTPTKSLLSTNPSSPTQASTPTPKCNEIWLEYGCI